MIATNRFSYLAPADSPELPTPAGLIDIKLEADWTDGAYALMVATVQPEGGPLPLHAHPFGETFWVLDGAFQFSTVTARGLEHPVLHAGEMVHVPSDVPHTFRNIGEAPARLLVVASPTLISFVREITTLAPFNGPLDMEKAGPITRKYGVVLVDPAGLRRAR